ncbi:MAG: hypothetical protein RL176_605 [Pseudomonadota bacterium]|jgi:hypothetical protein
MNDNMFTLIMVIITAAREGRYMHGNGRYYYIMEGNKPVCIDLINGTKMVELTYVGTPMVCTATANSLTSYLMLQDSESVPREYDARLAHDLVKEAVNSDRLLYTNGADWTILHTDGKSVISVNLGQVNKATISSSNQHGSWKYMQQMMNYRATISEATKKHMRF